MKICILGRQPEIGLAELESLYGSNAVQPAGDQCALVNADVNFSRLGGSVKVAQHLTTIDDISRKGIFRTVSHLVPKVLRNLPNKGKIKLGISLYGFDISPYELGGEALRIKKAIKNSGRSVRVVPNETAALSSAQTYHNHLADDMGIEFVIIHDGDRTHIGQVTNVQDIDSYRIRDRERPKRDAFVGMLPPKLAQTIINLATGNLEDASETGTSSAIHLQPESGLTETVSDPARSREAKEDTSRTEDTQIILDPFCGTGVILQESLLMGYGVYGTDLSKKMVDYSQINLKWLEKTKPMNAAGLVRLELADATDHIWRQPISVVATEAFLGQPLGGQFPTKEKFAGIVHDTNIVIRDFFKNIVTQLPDGARLCVAVPVWFHDGEVTHLPVVEELASIGFTQRTFTHAETPLMYHREDQITGRELLVLRKNPSV